MVDESVCLDTLGTAARRLGESPSKRQYEELGLTPASGTVVRVLGGWNEAKRAAGLSTAASTGSRTEPKPSGVDLPDGIEWGELSSTQRWHYRNADHNTERTADARLSAAVSTSTNVTGVPVLAVARTIRAVWTSTTSERRRRPSGR
ncbi:homing endonuclease associated repeat-containing protein [Halomarina litorea]|uniref:homing endonuclease associated repeat-containing protein n=1 Tax=Halomarina litorea TaxID=2961595 RepID=UPI0020C5506B|nr:hypothetical protein [Halomarina sp. BCD28]